MQFGIAAVVLLIILFFVGTYVVYDICFSNNPKYMDGDDGLPHGEQYEPFHNLIREGVSLVRQEPFEQVYISAKDGIRLAGKYYQTKEKAPVVIFFHGYRCSAIRDGNGLFRLAKNMGYNVLLADQRAHCQSEGKTITFGIKERYDCLLWAEYVAERFGNEVPILLAGLSMGAATVMMASNQNLPKNVKGILADCGYSSPKAILRTVMKSMHYPVGITYWMAKTGARIWGGFDLEETSALEALKETQIPVLLIHGDDDRFVPCSMSEECQKVGRDRIELVKIQGAGHGLCYCTDVKDYEIAVRNFCEKVLGV